MAKLVDNIDGDSYNVTITTILEYDENYSMQNNESSMSVQIFVYYYINSRQFAKKSIILTATQDTVIDMQTLAVQDTSCYAVDAEGNMILPEGKAYEYQYMVQLLRQGISINTLGQAVMQNAIASGRLDAGKLLIGESILHL